MATTLDLPTTCPACGRPFGILTTVVMEAHMIAHILAFMVQGLPNSRDASTDW
jgi:hypothetical protein